MLLAAWALVDRHILPELFSSGTHFGIFFLPLVLGLIVTPIGSPIPSRFRASRLQRSGA